MRYLFDTADATDDAGEELATIAVARPEAASYLYGLMKDDPAILADGRDFEVKVTDANGLALFTLASICIESPSISSSGRKIESTTITGDLPGAGPLSLATRSFAEDRSDNDRRHKVQTCQREIATEHLLFKLMEYVEAKHAGLLDFLDGNLDHLGDPATDETKDDEAVRSIARKMVFSPSHALHRAVADRMAPSARRGVTRAAGPGAFVRLMPPVRAIAPSWPRLSRGAVLRSGSRGRSSASVLGERHTGYHRVAAAMSSSYSAYGKVSRG